MAEPSVTMTLQEAQAQLKRDLERLNAVSQDMLRQGARPGPPMLENVPVTAPTWQGVVVTVNDPQRELLGERPAAWLSRRGVPVDVVNAYDSLDKQRLTWPPRGAVWLFDSGAAVALPLMRQIRAMGGVVHVNVDDYVWLAPPSVDVYRVGLASDVVRLLEDRLRVADGLTVQSPALAERVRHFGVPVRVIPQSLPPVSEWPKAFPRRPGGLRLGYVGTWMHTGDLELLREPVLKFLERVPDVTFVVGGCIPPWTREHPRIERHLGFIQPRSYLRWLASLQLDAFVIPLAANEWNECKSLLKPMEAGALTLPLIVSKVAPYAEALKHGDQCWFTENTPEAWLDALLKLAGDEKLRARLGFGAHSWAAERTIEQTGPLWLELFRGKT